MHTFFYKIVFVCRFCRTEVAYSTRFFQDATFHDEDGELLPDVLGIVPPGRIGVFGRSGQSLSRDCRDAKSTRG